MQWQGQVKFARSAQQKKKMRFPVLFRCSLLYNLSLKKEFAGNYHMFSICFNMCFYKGTFNFDGAHCDFVVVVVFVYGGCNSNTVRGAKQDTSLFDIILTYF